MLTPRENQIMDCGCPECGNPLDIVINDKTGVSFQCSNESCASWRKRIPFSVADKTYPHSAEKIKRIVTLRDALKKHVDLTKRLKDAQYMVGVLKRRSAEEQQHMIRCRDAYKAIKALCLFSKKGDRIYTKTSPYEFQHPESGETCEVYSIRQKRKATAMLGSLWYVSKEKFNATIEDIKRFREEIQKYRVKVKELSVMLSDKNNPKWCRKG